MKDLFNLSNTDSIICNEKTVDIIRRHVKLLTLFLKETSHLTESYILDYFVEKLWTCLPSSWLEAIMELESHDLVLFVNSDERIRYRKPWPLSLLAFRASAFALALPRKPIKSLKCVENFVKENFKVDYSSKIDWGVLDSSYEDKSGQHKSIPEFCRRHVKPKKQHEIFCMSKLAVALLEAFDIKHAIDIGSGQGHLSRLLALCYKLNVATIEAEQSHVSSAENFDLQAAKAMKNLKERINAVKKAKVCDKLEDKTLPVHIEGSMTSESSKGFLNKVFQKSEEIEEPFGILGLHTCGDLSTTILKMFVDCQQAKVLLSVGCCYMKLSSNKQDTGYPLSSYVKSLPNPTLSYEAKEMACHALEMYMQRLKGR